MRSLHQFTELINIARAQRTECVLRPLNLGDDVSAALEQQIAKLLRTCIQLIRRYITQRDDSWIVAAQYFDPFATLVRPVVIATFGQSVLDAAVGEKERNARRNGH